MSTLPEQLPAAIGGDPAIPADAASYARQLKQLLPPGLLWRLDVDSWLSDLLFAIGQELARVDARAVDLLDEWDPRTAFELLADWERVLGLPEPGTALAVDTRERQIAVARKLVARGGQTAAYFVELAARAGFVATVTETVAHTWRMDVDLAASSASYALVISEARVGTARAGDRIANRSVGELEAIINRAKPAHTVVLFAYS